MSQELDVDADPFLKLLTDALRAGPGSPEWHQAVARLRASGGADAGAQADEYRMLITAREHLESGKEYRSVRAGTGFTRKLMEGLEQEGRGQKSRGLPTASIIAIVSVLVIVGVLIFVGFQVFPRTPAETPRGTVEDLLRGRGELMNEVAVARFDAPGASSAGPELPEGWRRIGGLPLDASRGLRPAAGPTTGPATAPSGGGIVAPIAVGADEPFAAEVLLRVGKPSDDTLFEFFVSTDPAFSADRAKSANDLVWLLQGGRQKVLLSGREQADKPRPEPAKEDRALDRGGVDVAIPVHILMNHDAAIVECAGQPVWSGPHGLPAAPRYVGVRFLRTGPKAHDPVIVQEIRVRKK